MNPGPIRRRDLATEHPALPAGRQPWDPANGLRAGTMVGGLVGAAIVALSGIANAWIVAACAAIGAGIGYWSEKRHQRYPRAESGQDRPPCR